jgi:hypothetical protein
VCKAPGPGCARIRTSWGEFMGLLSCCLPHQIEFALLSTFTLRPSRSVFLFTFPLYLGFNSVSLLCSVNAVACLSFFSFFDSFRSWTSTFFHLSNWLGCLRSFFLTKKRQLDTKIFVNPVSLRINNLIYLSVLLYRFLGISSSYFTFYLYLLALALRRIKRDKFAGKQFQPF